jgi:hypothetical protein
MKRIAFLSILLISFLSGCGNVQPTITLTPGPNQVPVARATEEMQTLEAVPTFTSLPYPCATPAAAELNDFIQRSITIADNGKTFTTHVTSRFWIYLDDRIYPIPDLFNAIPNGFMGYVSNGSVRGPQCYPVMFEATKEGKGLLQLKDFQLQIVVDDSAPESTFPLP